MSHRFERAAGRSARPPSPAACGPLPAPVPKALLAVVLVALAGGHAAAAEGSAPKGSIDEQTRQGSGWEERDRARRAKYDPKKLAPRPAAAALVKALGELLDEAARLDKANEQAARQSAARITELLSKLKGLEADAAKLKTRQKALDDQAARLDRRAGELGARERALQKARDTLTRLLKEHAQTLATVERLAGEVRTLQEQQAELKAALQKLPFALAAERQKLEDLQRDRKLAAAALEAEKGKLQAARDALAAARAEKQALEATLGALEGKRRQLAEQIAEQQRRSAAASPKVPARPEPTGGQRQTGLLIGLLMATLAAGGLAAFSFWRQRRLERERDAVAEERQAMAKHLDSGQEQVQRLSDQLSSARQDAARQVGGLRRRLARSESELSRSQEELRRLRQAEPRAAAAVEPSAPPGDLPAAEPSPEAAANAHELTEQIGALRTRQAQLGDELRQSRAALDAKDQQLAEANARADRLREELGQLRARLEGPQAEGPREAERLRRQLAQATRRLEEQQARLWPAPFLRGSLDELKAAIADGMFGEPSAPEAAALFGAIHQVCAAGSAEETRDLAFELSRAFYTWREAVRRAEPSWPERLAAWLNGLLKDSKTRAVVVKEGETVSTRLHSPQGQGTVVKKVRSFLLRRDDATTFKRALVEAGPPDDSTTMVVGQSH